jgi:type VI secretion system protein ImpF
MPKRDPEEVVTQSVLDRLIDTDPSSAMDPPTSRRESVRALKSSLKRDLEWLLNTRRAPWELEGTLQELDTSLYNYGLPDVSTLATQSTKDRNRLLRMLEQAIATFEPRLERVKIRPLETQTGQTRMLRFQIEGFLKMDPAPEHVSFDTVLQLSTGEVQVKGDQSAG